MTLAQTLSLLFTLNILVVLGFLSLRFFHESMRVLGLSLGARVELRLHYFVLSVLFLLTLLQPLLPHSTFITPAAKVWTASSIKNFAIEDADGERPGYLTLPSPNGASTMDAGRVATAGWWISAVLLSMGLGLMFRDLWSLWNIRQKSFLVRRLSSVRIFISENIRVPFSYWLPGEANVVVPSRFLESPVDYQIAVAHELQHHRAADTRWVYFLWGMRVICVINPFAHLWNRWISEIQEFACDETLVDRNKVESKAYARCLLEVAQSAVGQKGKPVCATGLTFLIERKLLKRRIEKMLKPASRRQGRGFGLVAGTLVAIAMGATAFATTGVVQDRRVSLNQAEQMAAKIHSSTGFPIVVNHMVLKELNRFIGTPEGRDYMRSALQRMETYKSTIEPIMEKYQVPAEILAVPIMESGYQNLSQGQNGAHSAGVWQFIPQTARNFGLRVDDQVDQRLDVPLLTDAAMRYLQSGKLRFNDWLLSLMAYNMGEQALQKAIDVTGTHDAWSLIRQGYEGDRAYLAKVMAAVLIMHNPESLN